MTKLTLDFDVKNTAISPLNAQSIMGVSSGFLDSLPQDGSLYFNDDNEAMVCLETADELDNGLREALKKAGFEITSPVVMFSR